MKFTKTNKETKNKQKQKEKESRTWIYATRKVKGIVHIG
jgi:hypothetical protein